MSKPTAEPSSTLGRAYDGHAELKRNIPSIPHSTAEHQKEIVTSDSLAKYRHEDVRKTESVLKNPMMASSDQAFKDIQWILSKFSQGSYNISEREDSKSSIVQAIKCFEEFLKDCKKLATMRTDEISKYKDELVTSFSQHKTKLEASLNKSDGEMKVLEESSIDCTRKEKLAEERLETILVALRDFAKTRTFKPDFSSTEDGQLLESFFSKVQSEYRDQDRSNFE